MLGVGIFFLLIFGLLGCCALAWRPKYELAYTNRAEELAYLERTRMSLPEAGEGEAAVEPFEEDGAEEVGLLSEARTI